MCEFLKKHEEVELNGVMSCRRCGEVIRKRVSSYSGGQLNIPLYHGTSSLYLESIKRLGLGGVNPYSKYNIRDYLKKNLSLYESIYDDACKKNIDVLHRDIPPSIIKATIEREGGQQFSFLYEGTNFTPSKNKAQDYAQNPLGELLYSVYVFDLALSQSKLYTRPTTWDENGLAYLLSNLEKHSPIVFKLESIPLAWLQSESGEDPREIVSYIDENLFRLGSNSEQFDSMLQQSNFRILQNIPYGRMKIVSFE